MEQRPHWKEIKTYQEFCQYYWYREELILICKELGINHQGSKAELNHYIEEYYHGNKVQKNSPVFKKKAITDQLTLSTKLIDCHFTFNQRFRDFFIKQTGIENFKFNTDMVATAKKVKQDQDQLFTLGDMLDVYYGKREYAHFDSSSCQWNQFLKDFCADERSINFKNQLKVASILWKEVRLSTNKKVYTKNLIDQHADLIKEFRK